MQDLGKDSTVGVKGHTRAGSTKTETEGPAELGLKQWWEHIALKEVGPVPKLVVPKVIQGGISRGIKLLRTHEVGDVRPQGGGELVIRVRVGRAQHDLLVGKLRETT